jgi:hypothetical protein
MEAPGRWASSDDPVFRTPYSSHPGDGKIRACPRNAADRVSVPHFCQFMDVCGLAAEPGPREI